MKSRKIYYAVLLAAALVLSFASCVKDDLFDTSHPDKGEGIILIDWSGKDAEAEIPQSYTLRLGTEEHTVSSADNYFRTLLPQGSYELTVFNTPEGITINGNIATVNSVTEATRSSEDTSILPQPEYLFASHQTFSVMEDDSLYVTALMNQYVRRLDIALSTAGTGGVHVTSGTATLSGVARAIDITTGELVGTSAQTSMDLTPEDDESTVSFMILGVTPVEVQTLTADLTFSNGETKTVVSDLTEQLTKVNSSTETTKITGDLEIESVGGVMTARITGWQTGNGGGENVGIK